MYGNRPSFKELMETVVNGDFILKTSWISIILILFLLQLDTVFIYRRVEEIDRLERPQGQSSQ